MTLRSGLIRWWSQTGTTSESQIDRVHTLIRWIFARQEIFLSWFDFPSYFFNTSLIVVGLSLFFASGYYHAERLDENLCIPAYSFATTFIIYVSPSKTSPTHLISNDNFSLLFHRNLEKLFTQIEFVYVFAEYTTYLITNFLFYFRNIRRLWSDSMNSENLYFRERFFSVFHS